jgi:hypothetical protein
MIKMETLFLDKACALEVLQAVNPFLEERGLSTHSWANPPDPTYGGPSSGFGTETLAAIQMSQTGCWLVYLA